MNLFSMEPTGIGNDSNIVMYVEDDLDDQELFIECLKDVNPNLTGQIAGDGLEALKILAKIPPPLCIYIDINMPKMNGLDLLKALKAHPTYCTIPTFILSTTVSAQSKATAKALGAIEYLTKPHDFREYSELLKKCFYQHAG